MYKPIADSWQIYDNTDIEGLDLVASKMDNKLEIFKPKLWQSLTKVYDNEA